MRTFAAVRRIRRHESPWNRGQTGVAAIELVLVAPVLMVILLFVVGLGRMAHSRQQLEDVAADAARAASLERDAAHSSAAARTAADEALGRAGLSCTGLDVDVDLSRYHPGGQVGVEVTCDVELADVALAGFPGSRTFSASAVVPIETYRAS